MTLRNRAKVGMKKKDKLAVKSGKKFWGIAEKILEGLLESGFVKEDEILISSMTKTPIIRFSAYEIRNKVVEAIAEAIKRNLTYGNLGTLTLRNNSGQIVAKLYILPDGTLADDSWVYNEGWKP